MTCFKWNTCSVTMYPQDLIGRQNNPSYKIADFEVISNENQSIHGNLRFKVPHLNSNFRYYLFIIGFNVSMELFGTFFQLRIENPILGKIPTCPDPYVDRGRVGITQTRHGTQDGSVSDWGLFRGKSTDILIIQTCLHLFIYDQCSKTALITKKIIDYSKSRDS